jgi:dTDP-glucose 4,6-dehydratase
VGGHPAWERDIKQYSDLILHAVGCDDSHVTYQSSEAFTTRVKQIDSSKAARELQHAPQIPPEEGITRTVHWMRAYYQRGDHACPT